MTVLFLSSLLAADTLSFDQRVRAREAVERVYHNHRIWPLDNPQPKPPFEQTASRDRLDAAVADELGKSAALAGYWQVSLTADLLQAEMDRMAEHTQDPAMLMELFAALGNDPVLIAECLARPLLADRLVRDRYAFDPRFHGDRRREAEALRGSLTPSNFAALGGQRFQAVSLAVDGTMAQDHRTASPATLFLGAAEFAKTAGPYPPAGTIGPVEETAEAFVIRWTGRMTAQALSAGLIVFPKRPFDEWFEAVKPDLGTDPPVSGPTDALSVPACLESAPNARAGEGWTPTSTGGACPSERHFHTAVWTGAEMIVWGGFNGTQFYLNSGGRYTPATDSWTATSTGTDCPGARNQHRAVWTGTEMIVWGGFPATNTGGRYHPGENTWSPVTTTDSPAARYWHTAVWTGTEMIVWGGFDGGNYLNTGGRYVPGGAWTATPATGDCPSARCFHSAVWTNAEMIIWGGDVGSPTNTGGRYTPGGGWTATPTTGDCPSARFSHTAVWTGTQMIVWGGDVGSTTNTGARYIPGGAWSATSAGASCPTARRYHTAVWAETEMIVWGGDPTTNTGGKYDPSANGWSATTLTNAPDARDDHTAVWTGTAMIVWGGVGTSSYLQSGGLYSSGPSCLPPSGLTNNTAADLDACADTGVLITWSPDPADWGDGGTGTRTYDLLRDGSILQSGLAYGTTQYTDHSGVNNQTYTYAVRYNNGCGESAATAGTAAADLVTPPSGLTNNTAADLDLCADTGVLITWAQDAAAWGDGGTGTRTYDLLRDGSPIATGLAYGTTQATDPAGTNGQTYTYRVRYTNGCGQSAVTAGASAADLVLEAPGVFTLLSPPDGAADQPSTLLLDWSDASDAQEYDLYLGTSSPPPLYQAGIDPSQFEASGLSPYTAYSWFVRAVNACGESLTRKAAFSTGGPLLSLHHTVILDACPSGGIGDDNHVAEPGETIQLWVWVHNDGPGAVTGATGTLATSAPGVTVVVGGVPFPSLPEGGEATSTAPFVVILSGDLACMTAVPFTFSLAGDGASLTAPFDLAVGEQDHALFLERFETWPPAGWTVANDGGMCVWESTATTGLPNYTGGTGAAAVADSDWCGAGSTMDTELQSPPFTLPADPAALVCLPYGTPPPAPETTAVLAFWASYRDEITGGAHDAFGVDLSADGGGLWANLLTWDEDHSPLGPGEEVLLDLSPYAGLDDLRLRFTYHAADWHWWAEVDDAEVRLPHVCTKCGPPPGAFALLHPADAATGVSVDVTLDWEDAAGASCYTLYFGTTNPPPFYDRYLPSSERTVTALDPDAGYYWRVEAVNAYGLAASSGGVWSFQTGAGVGPMAIPGGSLQVSKNDGQITLSWDATCGVADDYTIYEGTLAALMAGGYDHLSKICTDAGGDRTETFTPGGGNTYYLVVPRTAAGVEGSYGPGRPQGDDTAACGITGWDPQECP